MTGPTDPPKSPIDPGRDDDSGTGLAVKSRTRTKRPSMYKVLMLNDDYTPMEFVVHVLERFFGMNPGDAARPPARCGCMRCLHI